MQLLQTAHFRRIYKKLHKNQRREIEKAVQTLQKDPLAGQLKTGDLAQVRVYKFRSQQQEILLAYLYNESIPSITLLAVGSHENFYRDLKRTT